MKGVQSLAGIPVSIEGGGAVSESVVNKAAEDLLRRLPVCPPHVTHENHENIYYTSVLACPIPGMRHEAALHVQSQGRPR